MKPCSVVLILTQWLFLLATAPAAEIYYSYWDGQAGCVSRLKIDNKTGKVTAQENLWRDEESYRATTLRRSPENGQLAVINELTEAPHLVAIDPLSYPVPITKVTLEDRPMQIQVAGESAYCIGHRALLHRISLPKPSPGFLGLFGRKEPRLRASLKIPGLLDPKPTRMTDFCLAQEGRKALLVFDQDGKTGEPIGHRIAVVDLKRMRVDHDLPLARDHEEFHFAAGKKDNGPGPKRILISPATNTAVVLLQNYGAVGLADLDGLLEGEWKNLTVWPTSSDGALGKSFPEEAIVVPGKETDYCLVSNASEDGGAAILDLGKRRMIQFVDVGPRGFMPPVYFPEARMVLAAHSGIMRVRGQDGIEKDHTDLRDLLIFDFTDIESTGLVESEQIHFDEFVYDVSPVPGTDGRLAIIATRTDWNTLDLVVYDIEQKESKDRLAAGGVVRKFVPVE